MKQPRTGAAPGRRLTWRPVARWTAAVVIVTASLLRLSHWGADLIMDETTAIEFVTFNSIHSIFTSNLNHILLSLLMRAINAFSPADLFFGLANPWPLRIPGILSSILSLLLLYRLASMLVHRPVAVLATAMLGFCSWALFYSHLLRGYTMSMCLYLLNAWLVSLALVRSRPRGLWLLPLTLAALHLTQPINAVYAACLACWSVLLLARSTRRSGSGLAWTFGLAWATGLAFAFLVYQPALARLGQDYHANKASANLSSLARTLLANYSDLLASPRPLALLVVAVSLLGLGHALQRRRLRTRVGSLIAINICLPPIAALAGGVDPLSRFFFCALPFWSLSFALGLYAVSARLAGPGRLRARLPLAVLLGALLIGLASTPQVAAFLSWNRGLRPREALRWMARRSRASSDFMIMFNTYGDKLAGFPRSDLEFHWFHYGFRARLPPFIRLRPGQDDRHLLRSHYFILAEDHAEADASLQRTGIDPVYAGALRQTALLGRLKVFELHLDASVLGAWRRAAASSATPAGQRAQALAGLGYDALRRERFEEAAGLLERAKGLARDDPRVRYLLGMARYMLFDDERAGAEFAWCVARDTDNAHAPFYLADTLAQRGRLAEALKAYAYYEPEYVPARPPSAWVHRARALVAIDACRRGLGRIPMDAGSAEALERTGKLHLARAAYERAVVLLARAHQRSPSLERVMSTGACLHFMYRYADDVRLLRAYVSSGGEVNAKIALAAELIITYELDEARQLLEGVLRSDPQHARARAMLAALQRVDF